MAKQLRQAGGPAHHDPEYRGAEDENAQADREGDDADNTGDDPDQAGAKLILQVGAGPALNQELARRAETKALAISQLKTMAEHNIQAGNAGMAQAIYQQMVGTSPQHDLTSSIREALAQMKREQEGQGPLEVTTQMPSLNQETQLSLYQLAFGGLGQLNEDILTRFGRNYTAGETLCCEGDDGTELFLILKGSVEASRKGQVLGTSSEGELIGEMAVLEGKPRSATVKALSDTVTLALNREHFQMIFQLHPSWTWKLLEAFSHRIAHSYQLMAKEI